MVKVESSDAKTIDASKIFPFNKEKILSATRWFGSSKTLFKQQVRFTRLADPVG